MRVRDEEMIMMASSFLTQNLHSISGNHLSGNNIFSGKMILALWTVNQRKVLIVVAFLYI